MQNPRLKSSESRCRTLSNVRLMNIGFGNMIAANRLVAIISPESAPVKRLIQDAREEGRLVDATYGRRTRSVIVTDCKLVILSAILPETIGSRLDPKAGLKDEGEED
ncbi:MAG: DUF370 domain-containing protein [Clostridia bacterium]|nr:DUF370 domain-containing protein [Clostridia bacterium]